MARAEERPADVPLVVLRPGETERHREDERVIGESAAPCGLGEGRGPGGVAVEERVGEGVAVAADELSELAEDVVGEEREAGLDLLRLLVFGDVEGVVVARHRCARRVAAVRVVGFDAHVRRRHQLGVGTEREARGALGEARFRFDEGPGGRRAHREER